MEKRYGNIRGYIKSEYKLLFQAVNNLLIMLDIKTLFITFIMGIVIHISAVSSYFVNHDSVSTVANNMDWLIVQGKWFVTPLTSIEGPMNISSFAILLGIFAFSLSAAIICVIFHIKSDWNKMVIGLCFVAFPTVSTATLYHAIDYFGMAFLLAVLSTYLFTCKGSINSIVAIIILAFSLGAYQAYWGIVLAVLVLECMFLFFDGEKVVLVIKKGIGYIVKNIIAVAMYYVILQLKLREYSVILSDYKGISNMKQNLRPDVLLHSVINAFLAVKEYVLYDSLGIYGKSTSIINLLFVLITTILLIMYVIKYKTLQKRLNLVMGMVLALLVLPVSANIVNVLAANTSFYYNSIAPLVILYCLPVIMVDRLSENECESSKFIWNGSKEFAKKIVIIIILMICARWIVQDNTAYHKVMLVNKEYDTKMTVLAAQIQNCEGYTTESKIYFVGEAPYRFLEPSGALLKFDKMYSMESMGLGDSKGICYSHSILGAWLNNKLSLNVEVYPPDEIQDVFHNEIVEMQVYPNSGSIQNIDDNIVVKLGDL